MKNFKSVNKNIVGMSSEGVLYPVLTSEKLLGHPRIHKYLETIQDLAKTPLEYYADLYQELITKFAEFVQIIPAIEGGKLGGMLEEGIKRAVLALEISKENPTEDEDPVFKYALFSAALLLDLRKLLVNKKVMISDEKGVFVAEWSPFEGSLIDRAEFYKIRHFNRPITQLSPYVTPLLARQTMPEAAFLWLTEHVKWFNQWLAILNGDEEGSGSLGHILITAKKHLREEKAKERNLTPIIPMEFKVPDPTAVGEAFWVWLKRGINDGSISVNEADSSVHIVEYDDRDANFLEVAKIFQNYCVYAKFSDWRIVYNQFNLLGLAEFSGDYPDTQTTLQRFIYFDKERILTEEAQLSAKDLKNAAAMSSFFKKKEQQRKEVALKEQQKQETGYKEGIIMAERKWLLADSKTQQLSQYLKTMEEKKKIRAFKIFSRILARRALLRKIFRTFSHSGPARAA
jgi:hypothetical protein